MSGVLWRKLSVTIRCDECTGLIGAGERVACFIESGLSGYTGSYRKRRTLCEPCGHLLEDSLTTTEEVA